MFNLRGLQAKAKVQIDVLDELLYTADYNGSNINSEAKKQEAINRNHFITMTLQSA